MIIDLPLNFLSPKRSPTGNPIPDAEFFAAQCNSMAVGVNLLKKKVGEGGRVDPHYQVLLFLYKRQPLGEAVSLPTPR